MRESLLALKSQLQNLIQVTQESLDAQKSKELKQEENEENNVLDNSDRNKDELDEEYALFMVNLLILKFICSDKILIGITAFKLIITFKL